MDSALSQLRAVVSYQFKAYPREHQTVEELVRKMEQLGNPIIEVTDEYVLCARYSEADDRWGCLLCVHVGAVTIADSQQELEQHLDLVHPGWRINDKGEPVA